MSPFKPIGSEPRWRTLYELLRQTATGAVLTYEQMGEALNLDPVRQRPAIASAMRRAAEEHEEQDKRAIEVVRDEGYRVVDVDGHLRLARVHNKRAGVQLELAYSKVTNVDLSDVDPEVRKAFDVVAHGFGQQMEINRRMSARQCRTERALDAVATRSERSEEEITEMRERLAALESRLGASDSA